VTMTIKEFCDKHSACSSGREWALSCGASTMQKLWQRDDLCMHVICLRTVVCGCESRSKTIFDFDKAVCTLDKKRKAGRERVE